MRQHNIAASNATSSQLNLKIIERLAGRCEGRSHHQLNKFPLTMTAALSHCRHLDTASISLTDIKS